ncbi:MAG: succinate dehydrogenase, cytochrome b556 subunit [Rhodospirillales bacterium]|nr:succinate dehydrogenase, cytochrome b556 subunit [Rhodospirillales bacterium]MBN8897477.1 succinate dehydrogenase, cytochrome b556 subunit [Rhodospirillales bacterium]MBN8905066.1 succinate dehydrogenase, cytochrome b556 subunit [Rhodospirillales bacterium]
MSPHLQIWRWTPAMAVSIMHRVTGVGLALGTLLMTWWLVAAATSDRAFANVQWFLGSVIGMFMLFCWTLSLMLHFFSGLRHIAWDAGWGFENRAYRGTSWFVIGAGIVSTLVIWIVGLIVW